MPLLVQNTANNVTIFSKGENTVIWQPAGDQTGDDSQRCPDSFADDVDFLKSLDVGLLKVTQSDKPELLKRLQRQSKQYQDRQETATARQATVIDRKQDKDIVSVPCIGPNINGRGVDICGALVLVRAAAQGEVPPLCSRHEPLAPEYYAVPEGSKGEGATDRSPGKVVTTWKRAEITAPVKGL